MIAASAEARAELAPGGTMRVGVNTANAATIRVAEDGRLSGPCIDLADALVAALDISVEYIRYASAGQLVAAEQAGDAWDVAFLAVDSARAARLHFAPPYLAIEAGYAVPTMSAISTIDEVDHVGARISTSKGAAYDLHLQRTLRLAERCPFPSPDASFAAFDGGGFEAVAGVRASLDRYFAGRASARVLPGSFLTIRHAIAIPAVRVAAAAFIDRFMVRHEARQPI